MPASGVVPLHIGSKTLLHKVRIMIQRIQSIYLLLAALVALSLLFLPFATSVEPLDTSPLLEDGAYTVTDYSGLTALFVLSGLLAIVAMLAYTDRKRQLLLARVAIGADLAGLVAVIFLGLTDSALVAGLPEMLSVGVAVPIVFAVLMVLAFRAILKDEKLIRSMDRLR